MGTTITSLEVENVKRVKAVSIEFPKTGLFTIGGRNAQGKTSILSAIEYALGGEKHRPSAFQRDGAETPARILARLSNGIVVEKVGDKKVKITDPDGHRAGQELLNEFIGEFAIDLPKFMAQKPKDKADTLLKIIGVGDQLAILDKEENTLYDERHDTGVIADRKEKAAKEMPFHPDVGEVEISLSDLTAKLQDAVAENGRRQSLCERIAKDTARLTAIDGEMKAAVSARDIAKETAKSRLDTIVYQSDATHDAKIRSLELARENGIADAKRVYEATLAAIEQNYATETAAANILRDTTKAAAQKASEEAVASADANYEMTESRLSAEKLSIESDLSSVSCDPSSLAPIETTELAEQIRMCEQNNAKIKENIARAKCIAESNELWVAYKQYDAKIEDVRLRRQKLLDGANLPLPGLSAQNGTLYYHGKEWDCMSGSEQLTVACAIASAINPKCSCILADGMEQYDREQLDAIGKWAEDHGLQIICTRVSTGDECSLIIEDGSAVNTDAEKEA